MPINITEEFVRNLMNQNAELLAQNAELLAQNTAVLKQLEQLNQTIQELRSRLTKTPRTVPSHHQLVAWRNLLLPKTEVLEGKVAKARCSGRTQRCLSFCA